MIKLVDEGASDEAVIEYVRSNYRLVLLTPEQASRLDRMNRSELAPDRIADAGIELYRPEVAKT